MRQSLTPPLPVREMTPTARRLPRVLAGVSAPPLFGQRLGHSIWHEGGADRQVGHWRHRAVAQVLLDHRPLVRPAILRQHGILHQVHAQRARQPLLHVQRCRAGGRRGHGAALVSRHGVLELRQLLHHCLQGRPAVVLGMHALQREAHNAGGLLHVPAPGSRPAVQHVHFVAIGPCVHHLAHHASGVRAAQQHQQEGHAHTVHVAGGAVHSGVEVLQVDEAQAAHHTAVRGEPRAAQRRLLGQPHIAQLGHAALGQQDVGGLEVAVHNGGGAVVQEEQPHACVVHHAQPDVPRHVAFPQPVLQGAALQQLHHHRVPLLTRCVDRHDVAVPQPRQQLHLRAVLWPPLQPLLVQHLDGHRRAVQCAAEDAAKAAAAESMRGGPQGGLQLRRADASQAGGLAMRARLKRAHCLPGAVISSGVSYIGGGN
mmetsp:Transcript_2120/g.5311  ORF Transcript_2120/g.5311 Transcript_2120/m.5311 type:complete len:426 (+) Transcript_2120:477-1754(+)